MIVNPFHYNIFHAGCCSVRWKLCKLYFQTKMNHQNIPRFRNKHKLLEQLMVDRSANATARVNLAPLLMNVDVHYCGPFQVNYHPKSNEVLYSEILMCLVVRTVHLELVMDLIT